MTPQRRRLVSNQARSVLDQNGISVPPVPVERIAKALGAQLKFSPLDDELSGMIFVKDGTPIIGINALHHPNRQRFSIAHECGHLLLHRPEITKQIHVDKGFPILMRNSLSAAGVSSMEIEANFFAAELLMPATFLARSLNAQVFDIDNDSAVAALAKEYKVSTAAMRHRLGNLTA